MSKYGEFYGPYFSVFKLKKTIYSINIYFLSESSKIWIEKNIWKFFMQCMLFFKTQRVETQLGTMITLLS